MHPVMMEFLKEDPDNKRPGDCVRCCIASLLELPRDEVPHFIETGAGWWRGAVDEFLEKRGWYMLEIAEKDTPKGFHLVSGPTRRSAHSGALHMVVHGYGVLRHDPHPSGIGLLAVVHNYILLPFDPVEFTWHGPKLGETDGTG